jgi:hypothetical protein
MDGMPLHVSLDHFGAWRWTASARALVRGRDAFNFGVWSNCRSLPSLTQRLIPNFESAQAVSK